MIHLILLSTDRFTGSDGPKAKPVAAQKRAVAFLGTGDE